MLVVLVVLFGLVQSKLHVNEAVLARLGNKFAVGKISEVCSFCFELTNAVAETNRCQKRLVVDLAHGMDRMRWQKVRLIVVNYLWTTD